MIDFLTCTMTDVIERSNSMHPTLFAEALESAAKVHSDYSQVSSNPQARRIASAMAANMAVMAKDIRNLGGLDVSDLTLGEKIQAFHVACKLQCVPHSLCQDIATRG